MKILQYPHPSLRYKAEPLAAIDNQVVSCARQMFDLMYEAKGIGLAAPQVGIPYQLIVINLTSDPTKPEEEQVWINPVLVERKGSVEAEEGCLSFPGLYAKVRRAKTVTVRAYNLSGELMEATASELPARALQHEIDHLHGVLFIDKLGPLVRVGCRAALKEFERVYKRAQERGEIPPDTQLMKMLAERKLSA